MKANYFVLIFLSLICSGCSVVMQSKIDDSPPRVIAPPSDKAMIVFYQELGGLAFEDNIFLDGKQVASLIMREKSYVIVDPGFHEIVVFPYTSLITPGIAKGNLKAGGAYYLGIKNVQNGFFEGPGYKVILSNKRLQDDTEDDSSVFGNLMTSKLVRLDAKIASKKREEHKVDIAEALAEAAEEWSNSSEKDRVYLIESKKAKEVLIYQDGKPFKYANELFPYGNF